MKTLPFTIGMILAVALMVVTLSIFDASHSPLQAQPGWMDEWCTSYYETEDLTHYPNPREQVRLWYGWVPSTIGPEIYLITNPVDFLYRQYDVWEIWYETDVWTPGPSTVVTEWVQPCAYDYVDGDGDGNYETLVFDVSTIMPDGLCMVRGTAFLDSGWVAK